MDTAIALDSAVAYCRRVKAVGQPGAAKAAPPATVMAEALNDLFAKRKLPPIA